MENAGIAVGAGKITDYLVVPVLEKFLRPIFCFQSIVDDFKEQNSRFIAIRKRVETEVQRDRDNSQVIYAHVEEWVKKANEEVMSIVQGMNERLEENKSCFRYSWCPGWTCHYRFSKQVSEMAATMKTLCELSTSFSSLSHPPALQQVIIRSSSSAAFVHSQSSRSAFDQIMEALKRVDINLIGLYGAAGAGKTTLAQQVGAEAKQFFKHVIMVPVSQHPQVRSMQGVIADFLGLQFDQQESDQGRAAKLQLRLKNGETILIIIDDVWKEFNLSAVVGTPSLDSGCKILLTSLAEIHVPNSAQKDIRLGALSEDEAWTLFKSITSVGDEVEMHAVAKDTLAECNGLPKAVVAMGTALKGKSFSEWTEALQQQLKDATFKIIGSLKEDVEKLSLRRDRVNTEIKRAKDNVCKIYLDVEKWLKDVESVMNDVEQFENEMTRNRWCFDKHQVATKVEALKTLVKDLYAQGRFEKISHPTAVVKDMELLTMEDFMFSQSAKLASGQIIEALKRDGVNLVGLYGMGGIGKTTLAKQVMNEVVMQNIFDHVVMFTVSQNPDVGNMQAEIEKVLGLDESKQNETLAGRSNKLNQRLRNVKVLVILDDVWKKFDLTTIGITLNECKGCKILMTTRRRSVCFYMNCQQEIQLYLFSTDESQIFFKKKAGICTDFELDDMGKQIVEECKCLPIALETVGAALKKKGKDEWIEALEKLRSSKLVDIIGVDDDDEKNAYRCLRVSYDYLKGPAQAEQAQFILLLCSLFPEDHWIDVNDLTMYAFGMKLFERVRSIEDARRKVRVSIRFLIDSCLLLGTRKQQHVKMHDVIRDTMLWIGGTESQERNILTVRDDIDLKDLIKKNGFQNCRAVSFLSDAVHKLSKYNKLECPNLEIVLICGKHGVVVELDEGFFKHMKFLKVFHFRGEVMTRCEFAIPQSFQGLEYLRALMLGRCECSNSSILRELKRLKVLSLRNCKIDCEVDVVSGLKKLRVLDLLRLEAKIKMFTSNVMETFIRLEELYGYTFVTCNDEEGTSSSLSEVKLLSNLVKLFVKVKDARCLPTGFCFQNLQSYNIVMGVSTNWRHLQWPVTTEEGRCLKLIGNIEDESVMISTFKKLLPTVQELYLEGCIGLCSLDAFNCRAQGFLQKLEILEVLSCTKMEWLFEFQMEENVCNNINTTVQIQSLKILVLRELKELKHVWKVSGRSIISPCNLTRLIIVGCSKLTCVFPSSLIASSLWGLEYLEISRCGDLKEIISNGGGSGDDDNFSCCCCFKSLRELHVTQCWKLKAIFPVMKSKSKSKENVVHHRCRLQKLEKIVLEHVFGHPTLAEEGVECPSLEVQVVTNSPKMPTSPFDATQLQAIPPKLQRRDVDLPKIANICVSSLKKVKLRCCNRLKQVFTASLSTSLHFLEELIVQRCNELEQVIDIVDDGRGPTIGVCFENLKTLDVTECCKLKTVFTVAIALPKLEGLKLESNAELEHVCGRSDWDCTSQYPFLQDLCIVGCPKMSTRYLQNITEKMRKIKLGYTQGIEELIQPERQEDNLLTSLETLMLLNLEELKCIWRDPPQNTCLSNLCQIEVIGCKRLKHIFAASIARNLPNLKKLYARGCNELEQVIIIEDGTTKREDDADTESNVQDGFKNLQVLHVSDCEKVKTVFSIFIPLPKLECLLLESNSELVSLFGQSNCEYTSPWTCLNELRVAGCPKLCKQFVALLKGQLQVQVTAQEMEAIKLGNIQGIEELSQSQRQDDNRDDDLLISPLLTLSLLNLEELKGIWCGPTQYICLSNLSQIEVIGCKRLKHIFTTSIAGNLPNLKQLTVKRCNELEQVIMIEDGKEEGENDSNDNLKVKDSFKNLQILHVSNCGKLKTIFPIFIPLPKIECLRLGKNAELEGVFEQSDCDHISHWRSLEALSVAGCPKLCTQFVGIIKSQLQAQSTMKILRIIKLSNIEGVEELIDFQRQGDATVDETIQLQRQYQVLRLEEVGGLRRIWSGPTQNISFSFLSMVTVIGCSRLKQLFTTSMAKTLHSLQLLLVERCHDLERVIEEEDGNEENDMASVQQLKLTNLKILRLIDLPKLVSFCPPSCNLMFRCLTEKNLKVEGCPTPITDFFSKQSYKEDSKNRYEGDDDKMFYKESKFYYKRYYAGKSINISERDIAERRRREIADQLAKMKNQKNKTTAETRMNYRRLQGELWNNFMTSLSHTFAENPIDL